MCLRFGFLLLLLDMFQSCKGNEWPLLVPSRACSIKPHYKRSVKPQRWPAPFIALQLIFQYPTEPRHKAGSHVECLVNGKHRRLGALHIQQCTVTQQGGEKKVGRVLKSSHRGRRCINSAPAFHSSRVPSENPRLSEEMK